MTSSKAEARAVASALLRTHRAEIARAVRRVGLRVAAGIDTALAGIPEETAIQSIAETLAALELFLARGDPAPLYDQVQRTIALRRLTGVQVPLLVAMSHAYLPGIRRSFARFAPSARAAQEAYDVVESAALPLVVHMLLAHLAEPAELDGDTERLAVIETEPGDEVNPFKLDLDDVTER